jgi:hypothetical protein
MSYYKEVQFYGTIENTAKFNNLNKKHLKLIKGRCYYKVGV